MSSACETCPSKSGCKSQDSCPSLEKEKRNKGNEGIKKVIGICSGKGGVGKSFVSSMLAVALSKKGYKVGIMDADVTGPSIPRSFGLHGMLVATDENRIIPAVTKGGIKAVSLNLLLDDEEAPVVWRGPVISGLVKQFWTDVDWGMLDVLLIDMPPGTGDVPLTVFQSIPVDGLVLVSTPQDLVSMIVSKARNMANMMNVGILGLVENMSYIKCPHCDEKISLFGDDDELTEAASKAGLEILDKLPLDSSATALVDSGKAEDIEGISLENTIAKIEALL
ncbi:MAG: Mrp/NBP35 family ATP-binding protein [Clostridiales bacterium]|nr:Mrp/NBP35 family ATP-binding protein [Clostridiales bacterium]